MSFIEVPLADAVEPELQVEGIYELMIRSADPHIGKDSGKPSIQCLVDFVGVANAQTIFHYMSLPAPDDDAETRNTKLVICNQFLDRFGIPHEANGFATEDFPTRTGKFWVGQEEDNNGVMRNRLTLKKV